jgi:5-deoxy-glucuronate isomerase
MVTRTKSDKGASMNRHIKSRKNGNLQEIVPAGSLRFLDFTRLQISKPDHHSGQTGAREAVLDVFAGSASIRVATADGKEHVMAHVGGRPDVFSGPPVMVYIPPNAAYEIAPLSENLDLGIFSAPSQATAAPALLHGPDVVAKDVGQGNWQRTVYSALAENVPAERLLAGETLNPPGNWSSYPPHKHDRSNPPQEAVLEEIYFFRLKPAQGYGFIWTYTAPDDPDGFSDVFVVEDGDTVLLPKGYHPVVAAPGYELHYTWVLAGEERRYGAWADDPRHAWVKNQ